MTVNEAAREYSKGKEFDTPNGGRWCREDFAAGAAWAFEQAARIAETYTGPTDRLCLRIAQDIRTRSTPAAGEGR